MRIGLVCPYSFEAPGGVQNHVLGLARYLRETGHEPHLLAPGELGGAAADVLDAEHFTTAGAAVPVRYNGSVARVNFGPLSAARVRRWLRDGDFDLLHLHEPITPSISLLALWSAEVPVVATFHTATPRSRSMQLAGGVLRPLIEKIDAGIAVSGTARRVVVEHLGRDAVVIPNGIWVDEFGPPRPRPRRVVFLGRVDEPRKGLDVLLAAAAKIRAAVPDVELVVAGQGDRVLPAYCTVLGQLSNHDKADLLAGAAVFVAPHLERESFGIVLVEAMASGAPVVASDIAPFAELVGRADTASGLLFPPGDADALAEAVVTTLQHPEPHRAVAARAAARRFDWSEVGAAVTQVYEATLAATGPATRLDRVGLTWAALDAALLRRAQRAAAVIQSGVVDPASALLLADAAGAALEPDLPHRERERVESDLSEVLLSVGALSRETRDALQEESVRAGLSRHLHNEAVTAARALRRRRVARRFRLTGHAGEPRPFEMVDGRQLGWPRDG